MHNPEHRMINNRQWLLASRPEGEASASNFRLHTETIDARALAPGQVLIKHRFLSLDPYMRGRMNESKSYAQPQPLDAVMIGGTVGDVVASSHAGYAAGDVVVGMGGWQEYSIVNGDERGLLRKVDTTHVPASAYLGAVGMPGVTAWYGLVKIIDPKAGSTVVVSAASGAVGGAVGQLAKARGARAVGIAGGEAKCRYVTEELGFDACIDYKNQDVRQGLKDACPNGVDVYFDNVGGDILDIVLTKINLKARIVICGAISQYNNTAPVKGPSNYLSLLVNRARMEGIVVFDYAPRYREGAMQMAQWLKEGKMVSKEHVEEGIDRFPEVLGMLFRGENFGKLVLKVA